MSIDHIELCRLHLWNNKWSEIKDYTPGIQHWDFLQRVYIIHFNAFFNVILGF